MPSASLAGPGGGRRGVSGFAGAVTPQRAARPWDGSCHAFSLLPRHSPTHWSRVGLGGAGTCPAWPQAQPWVLLACLVQVDGPRAGAEGRGRSALRLALGAGPPTVPTGTPGCVPVLRAPQRRGSRHWATGRVPVLGPGSAPDHLGNGRGVCPPCPCPRHSLLFETGSGVPSWHSFPSLIIPPFKRGVIELVGFAV